MTEASANVADSELVIAGRSFGRELCAMMMKQPAKVPAQPTPVIARPAMKASLLGAVAHIKLPSSKMKILSKKTYLTLKYLNALPHID
jgi:hypothetical protein